MANSNLSQAKRAKNDEFYTQYADIEKEMMAYLDCNPDVFRNQTILLPCDDPEWSNFTKFFAQNFERFGLKKLISTSYAADSKSYKTSYTPTPLETEDPQYDKKRTANKGKLFTLDHDITGDGKINVDDLEWRYLDGDGDFRSDEIKALRDEADVIITNPPFSLFRVFLAWIVEADKQFVMIGNQNAITYKEVFPLMKDNKVWLGNGFNRNCAHFINKCYDDHASDADHKEGMIRVSGVQWYTNIDHGRRHQPLALMSMADNRKFNKKVQKNSNSYQHYDNYDAIEVPFTNAIPSDYDGVMGVPITFMNKYCPEQFEIVGCNRGVGQDEKRIYGRSTYMNGKETFKRLFIRKEKP